MVVVSTDSGRVKSGLQVGSSARGAAVEEGDDVTLTCKTTCSLTSSPSFIWSKDGRPVGKKQITNNQLQLHPFSREDEGNYTCAVTGHEELPSPPFRLNVHCKKVVVSDKDKGKEGDNVTLTCNIINCPEGGSTSFTWSKDGRPVEKKQSTSNQLQLRPVSREDEGSYTCAVRGHEDLPSPPFRLNVHCLHTVQTDKDKVKVGDIVTLTCNTTCPLGGSTSFTWSKDGHPVEPVEKKKQITNNQLQLHSVSREDEGSYTCAVTGHDASSEPFVLKVKVEMKSRAELLDPITQSGRQQLVVLLTAAYGNTVQMNSLHQSLNPNTTQPDADYQNMNPNTTQPDAVYQSLNPNTIQPDPIYQSLSPNTSHPDAVYQSLNPNTTQPDAVYQCLNPNTTQPDAVYQCLNPNTIQPDAVYQSLNPNTTQPDAVY
ncbi:hypothetical protein ACEWY4_017276 [Coilia grayii]|uniref:Ig-like domain-containing protein n=1 Tax=Coilia grayii TaxID=363190 RepID=A0ABD1JGP6_9TELE